MEEEAAKMEVRLRILALMQELFAADPKFAKKPLSALNKEAVVHIKAGDDARAVAAYAKVFKKIKVRAPASEWISAVGRLGGGKSPASGLTYTTHHRPLQLGLEREAWRKTRQLS